MRRERRNGAHFENVHREQEEEEEEQDKAAMEKVRE